LTNGLGGLQARHSGVVVTEHFEKDFPHEIEKPLIFDIDEYFVMMTEKQANLPDGFSLYTGIELGYQKHLPAFYDALVKSYPFDSVYCRIISMRQGSVLLSRLLRIAEGRTLRPLHRRTRRNDRILDDFDIVGHYDYIARYAP
jgi:histidinol-phosphatase (PHP family)